MARLSIVRDDSQIDRAREYYAVMSFAVATASHRARSDDRILVLATAQGVILGLADGAGGQGGGGVAADGFLSGLHRAAVRPGFELATPAQWCALLTELDHEIEQTPAAGETTGVALAVTADAIIGASCGDSEAWLFSAALCHELTTGQSRRPRLGSGRAEPRSFLSPCYGTLVIASDGLFNAASRDAIARIALASGGDTASALLAHLRAHHRTLPDDVAIIAGPVR